MFDQTLTPATIDSEAASQSFGADGSGNARSCRDFAVRALPWVYWPVIALLVLGGLAELADSSETAAGIVAAFVLFGTFGMVVRAEERGR